MKQILNKLHIYAFFAFIVIAFLALPNQTFAMAGVGGKIYERINGVEVPLVVTVDAKITPPVGGISNLSTTSSPIFTNLSVETGNGTLQVYGNYAFGKIDCAVVGNSRYEIRPQPPEGRTGRYIAKQVWGTPSGTTGDGFWLTPSGDWGNAQGWGVDFEWVGDGPVASPSPSPSLILVISS